jgi:hypothetical protein
LYRPLEDTPGSLAFCIVSSASSLAMVCSLGVYPFLYLAGRALSTNCKSKPRPCRRFQSYSINCHPVNHYHHFQAFA